MKRWVADGGGPGALRMWTIAAGAVVDQGNGLILLALDGPDECEVTIGAEAAAELADALIEATTGPVPDPEAESQMRQWPQPPPGTHMGGAPGQEYRRIRGFR